MKDDARITASELLLATIIILIAWTCNLQYNYNKTSKELEYYKSIIEKADDVEKQDSIIYNIKYKDSIITNIKKELKYETEYIKDISDSAAVAMFNKLVSE